MDPYIDSLLRYVTAAGVIATFLSVAFTIRSVRRQINAEILMKYTERYEHILDSFHRTPFSHDSIPGHSRHQAHS